MQTSDLNQKGNEKMNNNFKDSGSFGVSDDDVDFGGTTPINSKPNNK